MSVKFPVKLSREYAELTEEEITEVSSEDLLIKVNRVFVTYDEFARIRYSDITRNQSVNSSVINNSILENSSVLALSFSDLKAFIPVFDGRAEDAFNFVYSCSQAMELASQAQATILFKYIQTQRRGNAQIIILNENFVNWESLKKKLKGVYKESHSSL